MSLTAPPEAIYDNVDSAFTEIQAHTKEHGYVFCRYQMRSNRRVFACDCAGKYDSKGKDPNTYSSKQRESTGSKKCGCLMRVELYQDKISSNWVLKVLETIHNHGLSAASTAYPAYRLPAMVPGGCNTISILSCAGLLPGQILNTLYLEPEVPLLPKDIYNFIQKARLEELDGRTLIQWLLEVIIPALIPAFLDTYTDLYRSFKATTSTLDISLNLDPSSDLPLYIQSPLFSGNRILVSCSLIAPIRLIGTICYS
jgi:hypothetical protein